MFFFFQYDYVFFYYFYFYDFFSFFDDYDDEDEDDDDDEDEEDDEDEDDEEGDPSGVMLRRGATRRLPVGFPTILAGPVAAPVVGFAGPSPGCVAPGIVSDPELPR